jgi:hypothetical protein
VWFLKNSRKPPRSFCVIAVRVDFREFFLRGEKIEVGKEFAITGFMFPTILWMPFYANIPSRLTGIEHAPGKQDTA